MAKPKREVIISNQLRRVTSFCREGVEFVLNGTSFFTLTVDGHKHSRRKDIDKALKPLEDRKLAQVISSIFKIDGPNFKVISDMCTDYPVSVIYK